MLATIHATYTIELSEEERQQMLFLLDNAINQLERIKKEREETFVNKTQIIDMIKLARAWSDVLIQV